MHRHAPPIKILLLIPFIIGLHLSVTKKSMSCPIPVFRYALEYWKADDYTLEIFYQNSLNPEEEELANLISKSTSDGNIKVNLDLKKTDIKGGIHNINHSYLNDLSMDELPWMVLRYPRISGINKIIWTSPLNKRNVNLLLNSPVRKTISAKLLEDVSAVWVFLESGNKKKDRSALDRLEKNLKRLEETLVLTDPAMWWGDPQDIKAGNIPEIKFDVISVSRHDDRENPLIEMLLNSENDLQEFESEPMVFPVYGRGIILYAIVGKGINEWNIRDAAEFITGDCSCQAKVNNPGLDLLISMDWEKHVEHLTDISRVNPLSGMGDFQNREEEVRRRLELATLQRLGKASKNTKIRENGSGKVVYLDIPGATPKKTQEKPADAEIENNDALKNESGNKKSEAEQEKSANFELSDRESLEASVDESQDKMNIKLIFILVFAGIIVIVLVGGVALYYKNNR